MVNPPPSPPHPLSPSLPKRVPELAVDALPFFLFFYFPSLFLFLIRSAAFKLTLSRAKIPLPFFFLPLCLLYFDKRGIRRPIRIQALSPFLFFFPYSTRMDLSPKPPHPPPFPPFSFSSSFQRAAYFIISHRYVLLLPLPPPFFLLSPHTN